MSAAEKPLEPEVETAEVVASEKKFWVVRLPGALKDRVDLLMLIQPGARALSYTDFVGDLVARSLDPLDGGDLEAVRSELERLRSEGAV